MKTITLTLGEYETNCYLVCDEKGSCAVIDPGYEAETIRQRASEEGLSIRAIFLTHGHFDHVGGVRALAQRADCPVYLHRKEEELPSFLTDGALYYTAFYGEGDRLQIGELEFSVLETPGHTMGSVCLQCEGALFTGDTLFSGSCGRTDLGGSPAAMGQSLRRLAELSENFRIYPGHGPESDLKEERRSNPYLR